MNNVEIISASEHPEIAGQAVDFLTAAWPGVGRQIYEDCVVHSVRAGIPEWYLLYRDTVPVGCAGIIMNDFISRQDLWPWLVALYIKEEARGQNLAAMLIERCKRDAAEWGYPVLYLSTDHTDYYERFGFRHIADGYHPGGDKSKIYSIDL